MSAAYIGRLSLTHANAGDLALHRAIAQNDLDKVRRLLDNDATLRLLDPAPPPPRVRIRTHWRLRIAFHVIGRRASNPRSKRHELGLYRVSDIASFLLPGE